MPRFRLSGDGEVDVDAEFFVEVGVELAAAEDGSEPGDEGAEEVHRVSWVLCFPRSQRRDLGHPALVRKPASQKVSLRARESGTWWSRCVPSFRFHRVSFFGRCGLANKTWRGGWFRMCPTRT